MALGSLRSRLKGHFMQNLCSTERKIINTLLDDAALFGFVCSVFDGEEFSQSATGDYALVRSVIGATDHTALKFRDPTRLDEKGHAASIGHVLLIHGNGSDVISDYSDTASLRNLVGGALDVADEL